MYQNIVLGNGFTSTWTYGAQWSFHNVRMWTQWNDESNADIMERWTQLDVVVVSKYPHVDTTQLLKIIADIMEQWTQWNETVV